MLQGFSARVAWRRQRRGRRRDFLVRRGGVRRPVAERLVDGGDGSCRARERDPGERVRTGERVAGRRSDPDGSRGSVRGATQASRQEVARARVCARRARARRPSGAVETTTGSASQLGRPVGPLGCLAAGKVQVGLFLYLFSFLFF